MTPDHLIQLTKLKKVEQLMSSTTCTLKEISDMLHFHPNIISAMSLKILQSISV